MKVPTILTDIMPLIRICPVFTALANYFSSCVYAQPLFTDKGAESWMSVVMIIQPTTMKRMSTTPYNKPLATNKLLSGNIN